MKPKYSCFGVTWCPDRRSLARLRAAGAWARAPSPPPPPAGAPAPRSYPSPPPPPACFKNIIIAKTIK